MPAFWLIALPKLIEFLSKNYTQKVVAHSVSNLVDLCLGFVFLGVEQQHKLLDVNCTAPDSVSLAPYGPDGHGQGRRHGDRYTQ